jgi:predicted PurR-regulated permease PerM
LKSKTSLTIPNFAGIFLLVVISALLFGLYTLYSPFITVLIFAVFFATIFYPIFRRLKKLLHGRGRIASITTCFFTLLVIAIPVSLFATLLVSEGIDAFNGISTKVQEEGYIQDFLAWEEGSFLYDQMQKLAPIVNTDSFNINEINFDFVGQISSAAQQMVEILRGQLSNVLGFIKDIIWFIVSFMIFFFALYYLFKDGDMIIKKVMDLSPLPQKHEKAIFKKFKEVSLAMLFGIFFTAIIQGTLAGIGYAVVGLNNPFFWATATALFSLVPLLGTAIIWVPASLILFLSGNPIGGVGLFLWGVMVVGTVDNLIRPYLIEGRAPVHPLLTFLAVFGGILAFNLPGIIYGPIILNLLLAFLHIYELEYAKVLKN